MIDQRSPPHWGGGFLAGGGLDLVRAAGVVPPRPRPTFADRDRSSERPEPHHDPVPRPAGRQHHQLSSNAADKAAKQDGSGRAGQDDDGGPQPIQGEAARTWAR